ncbi:MAG: aldo/keto reductase [Alphaproteobacteria bacterium]|nr:aldo/keto reductase [Alphaproteobacteria bacterium]
MSVVRRTFGGVQLSPICLGTMRLDPARLGRDDAVRLLAHLVDHGVDTVHTSHEYASHAYALDVLAAFRRAHPARRLVHVVKLAEPHFEDPFTLDPARLLARLDAAQAELGVDRVDVLQWLLRSKPIEDGPRLALLRDRGRALADALDARVREGRLGAWGVFPYGVPFAEAAVGLPGCAGLVSYLGLAEREHVGQLDALQEAGQAFVAIRPLWGGRLTARGLADPQGDHRVRRLADALELDGDEVAAEALAWPLRHPAVASVMVSLHDTAQADAALRAVEGVRPDPLAFHAVAARLTAAGA